MEMQRDPLNPSPPVTDQLTQQQLQKAKRKKRMALVNAAFLENSIPAIRKMARSPDCNHRIFWSTVFMATFTGFVIHLGSIVIRYRSTPVSTETRVEPIDTMPSILICPQNYLSGTRIGDMLNKPNPLLRDMTFQNVYNEILPMFWNFIYQIRNSSSIDRKMVGMKIKNNFLWYLIHVWKQDGEIQHEKHDVFLHLAVQNSDELTVEDIFTTFDSQRNRCFAWEPTGHVTNPLTAILNVPDGRYFYAEQDAFELVSDSGLWLHICFNQSYGCHDSIRYFLPTGHYTKIDLRKMVISQHPVVSENQSSCVTGNRFYSLKQDQFENTNRILRVAYTSALCSDIQLQQQIYEKCGCLSVLLPMEIGLYNEAIAALGNTKGLFCNLPPDEAFTHGQFPKDCRNDPLNDTICMVSPLGQGVKPMPFRELLARESIKQFLERDSCHDDQFKARIPTEKCPKVCRREQFTSVHSIVPWPESQLSRTHASTFARIFVKTVKPFLDRAISNGSNGSCVLEAVRSAFLDGMNWTKQSKPNYEKGLRFMQQRLLLLEIGYASADMQVMSESESYPLKSFLSDIGGIMGLWIGMAIVSVCEFCLMFWRLIFYACKRGLRRVKT